MLEAGNAQASSANHGQRTFQKAVSSDESVVLLQGSCGRFEVGNYWIKQWGRESATLCTSLDSPLTARCFMKSSQWTRSSKSACHHHFIFPTFVTLHQRSFILLFKVLFGPTERHDGT